MFESNKGIFCRQQFYRPGWAGRPTSCLTAVAVTVTPKSTATFHRITAGSGPGARREVWPASNYQVAAWNYLQVDSLVKLVAHRGCLRGGHLTGVNMARTWTPGLWPPAGRRPGRPYAHYAFYVNYAHPLHYYAHPPHYWCKSQNYTNYARAPG